MGSPSRKKGQQDGEHGAGFVDGHHLVDVTQLEGLEVAQPGGSGSQAGQHQKEERCGADVPDLPLGAHDKHHGPRKNQHHKGCGWRWPRWSRSSGCRTWPEWPSHRRKARIQPRRESTYAFLFSDDCPLDSAPSMPPPAETPCPGWHIRASRRSGGGAGSQGGAPSGALRRRRQSRRPPSGRLRQSTRS